MCLIIHCKLDVWIVGEEGEGGHGGRGLTDIGVAYYGEEHLVDTKSALQ